MDDNDDRKAKENDKIYKIIFENKNTRANIRMGINLGIILIIALIVVGVFFIFIIKYKYGDVIEEVKNRDRIQVMTVNDRKKIENASLKHEKFQPRAEQSGIFSIKPNHK